MTKPSPFLFFSQVRDLCQKFVGICSLIPESIVDHLQASSSHDQVVVMPACA